MTRMLDHRGPDQWGVVESDDNVCVLGNTRLAIVDPNTSVTVPYRKPGRTEILTFNGEIYDYRDVRKKLSSNGVTFETHCDTEVLFEALLNEGKDVLSRLDGMWAFAYYEPASRSILLSRDIMGERHIFYQIAGDELLFASEPAPILMDQGYTQTIDYSSMVSSFLFGVPAQGKTLLNEVKRLLPGHNLHADVAGNVQIQRYRRFNPEKWFDFFSADPSTEQVVQKFQEIFDSSVRRRLPTDVDFISTLSGGLDSTIISISASDYGKKKTRTLFGASSDEPQQNLSGELDEYSASVLTAKKYNLDHHYIQMNTEYAVPNLKHFASTAFDGCVDVGISSFAMLGQHVREDNSKVILISDGPDELIGGYQVDRKSYNLDLMRESHPLSFWALNLISGVRNGRRVMGRLGYGGKIISQKYSVKPFSFEPIHSTTTADFLGNILPQEDIYSQYGNYGTLDSAYQDIIPHMDFTQQRSLSYACQSLPDIFNLRTDKAFSSKSVESRVPFQAPDMVDFLLAAPAQWRFNKGETTKHLLRLIVDKLVGSQVSTRSKHGFSASLVNTPKVYAQLDVEEVLRSSALFQEFPFKANSVDWLLDPQARKMRWMAYVVASTDAHLLSERSKI